MMPLDVILDLESIWGDLTQIFEQYGTEPEVFRAKSHMVFEQVLQKGKSLIQAHFEKEGKGRICAERLALLEDGWLQILYAWAHTFYCPPPPDTPLEPLCLAAVGGYGRGTLAPHSDIDVLFLLPQDATLFHHNVIQAMLQMIWDVKQKVGYATRSVSDCLFYAKEDMTIRTTLLEARFLAGNAALFDLMRHQFQRTILGSDPRDFVAAKLAERDKQIEKAGHSRYLVEPNVKTSKGGLRDLNTLYWIATYVYQTEQPEDLVTRGIFTRREAWLFKRCEEFLWRVRCHLHFLTGRAVDHLSFDLQPELARRLGYVQRRGLSSVERFMKHYFLVAKEVGDLTALLCADLEAKQAKPQASLDRTLDIPSKQRPRQLPGTEFWMDVGRLRVKDKSVFEKDPVNLIRLFWLASRYQAPPHPETLRLVTQSLKYITLPLRHHPVANRLFVEILTSRHAPETVLRSMNEAGVLGRFIPDFGRIVAMMQFSKYHHYTVDEHLLRAVGSLSALEAGRLAAQHPLASWFLPTITNRRALYVATFLHDIAKGRPEDHSIEGARISRHLCPRLGLTPVETEIVAWLIEHHLDMSTIAQSRDLSDPVTIHAFAQTVQTLERLRLLLMLTICDIRAVGPHVWTGWKGQLLRTLYWETELVLAGGHATFDRQARVEDAQRNLRDMLPHWSEAEWQAYVSRHDAAYWIKVDQAHQFKHAQVLQAFDAKKEDIHVEHSTDSFRGFTEILLVTSDQPHLLSFLAGSCAAVGANIVDAQIFTTQDGLALDSVFIARTFERDEDELRRAHKISAILHKSLQNKIELSALVSTYRTLHPSPHKAFHIEPQVMIDNTLSQNCTIMEISALDRPGLLFDLTSALSELKLNIRSAHIVTFGEKAVDVFYVTHLKGGQITRPSTQTQFKRHILKMLKGKIVSRLRKL